MWRELVNRLETLAAPDPSARPSEPAADANPTPDPASDPDPRYRQAVAGSPDPIFLIDLGGLVRAWNPACERVFGYGQEVVGGPYRPLVVSPDEGELETLCGCVKKQRTSSACSTTLCTTRSPACPTGCSLTTGLRWLPRTHPPPGAGCQDARPGAV